MTHEGTALPPGRALETPQTKQQPNNKETNKKSSGSRNSNINSNSNSSNSSSNNSSRNNSSNNSNSRRSAMPFSSVQAMISRLEKASGGSQSRNDKTSPGRLPNMPPRPGSSSTPAKTAATPTVNTRGLSSPGPLSERPLFLHNISSSPPVSSPADRGCHTRPTYDSPLDSDPFVSSPVEPAAPSRDSPVNIYPEDHSPTPLQQRAFFNNRPLARCPNPEAPAAKAANPGPALTAPKTRHLRETSNSLQQLDAVMQDLVGFANLRPTPVQSPVYKWNIDTASQLVEPARWPQQRAPSEVKQFWQEVRQYLWISEDELSD